MARPLQKRVAKKVFMNVNAKILIRNDYRRVSHVFA